MEFKTLEKKDHKRLAVLLNNNLKSIYPFKDVDEEAVEVFLQDNKSIENAETVGAFEKGDFRGAACFGILPKAGKKADFDLINPGDGVILWLVCVDVESGYKLLAHCLSKLPEAVFAYPEFGSLRSLSLFNTGMLPSSFTKEETVFRTSAFCIPEGKDWGPQERCWFRWEVPGDLEPLSIPKEFEVKREEGEGYESHIKVFDKGVLIGQCDISNLKLCGRTYPKHFYVTWLWVNEAYRSHSLGRKMMLDQCRVARERGASTNILTTHTGRPAHKLYKKLGWTGVGIARTFCIKQK